MSKKILEVSHLSISFDNKKSCILQDISFSLGEGEILSVIGKNGSGKSSLLRAIAGVETSYSGEILRHTQSISYIPQKLLLENNFPLQVGEFFSIFNAGDTTKKAKELLETFGAKDLHDKNIHHLSGGELQKVLIVNALLGEPELLLMDEPTAGIDILGEEQFYENIAEIRRIYPKMGIILVSHNLHLVYKNSSRVICLHENNLCCHGTPSEILENEDINKVFGKYLRPYEHHTH